MPTSSRLIPRSIHLLYALALCCFSLATSAVSAAETPHTVAGNTVYYYYDENAEFDVVSLRDNVISKALHRPLAGAEVPLGTGQHWVFFDIPQRAGSESDPLLLEIDFPNIDRVEAFIDYAGGEEERFVTGDEVAFKRWPIRYRKPTIPLDGVAYSGARVFICVKSETPLILPLRLLPQSEQHSVQQGEYILYGLFYGAIFILAIYNAAVYFSLRDSSYRFYILYILAFSLVQASTTGIGQQFLWPGLDHATTRIALLAIIFTHFFMVQFVIHFLDIAKHKPALLKPLRWIAYFALLLAPLLALPHYAYTQFAIHLANVGGMLAIIGATLSVFPHNRRPALYLLTSHLILFSAITLALLFQADLIDHYAFIDYSMSMGILIEAVILSVGLSDRIRQLRNTSEAIERDSRLAQEQLSQQLIQTREQERAEMSRLLHDSVNHDLVVIRNRLTQAAKKAQSAGGVSEELQEIDALLNNTIGDVRNISHMKHPQMVRHLGLEPALAALVENTFDANTIVNVHVEDIPLPYDVQMFLYRAVQECTTNIIKHADASECIIRLYTDKSDGSVHFIIKDDGRGFDAEGRNWRFGLRTLNEHCKSLGGLLTVSSCGDEGTTLSVVFPQEQEAC